MSLIRVENLTFQYEGSYQNIFENVSFQIDTDWKLGFIGRNGRGKTTFLNLLTNMYEYNGTISASVSFEYFPYIINHADQQVIHIVESIHPDYQLWNVTKELSLLGLSPEILNRPYSTLSGGEQTKLLLGILFSKPSSFLLIDEPTNHLDTSGRMIVTRYLAAKKGFIIISHDRRFLDGCVDHILAINKCNIEVAQGNFSTWWENKENRDKYEISENEKLERDIKRLSEAAKQTAMWSDRIESTKIGNGSCDRGYIGHKAAKMMKRAKAIQNRVQSSIDEKKTLLKDIETIKELKIFPLHHYKKRLIAVKDLSLKYGEKVVCEGVQFEIEEGQRVVLSGKNGCGKSSIIKKLLGEDIDYSGSIEIASNLIISYVPQVTSSLNGSLGDFIQQSNLDETLFKAILRKLDFKREQFAIKMEDYSEGQKKKVLIAKSLCEKAHLYIWDEPLNYIDIFSRIQIEQIINQYQPTMILVEHDSAFVDTVATAIVQM